MDGNNHGYNGGPGGPVFISMPSQMQPHKPDRAIDQVPKRVQVAMGVLDYATEKTESRIAVSGVGMEEFDGQPLDVEEKQMFVEACKVMTMYLQGKLPPTVVEEEEREQAKKSNKRGERTLLRCPQCGGNRHVRGTRCTLCKGEGGLSCEPATLTGDDDHN